MKVLSKEKVAESIEKIVWDKDISYMDATLEFFKTFDIDIENIPRLLNDRIKAEIQMEAEKLNLLPKQNRLDKLT